MRTIVSFTFLLSLLQMCHNPEVANQKNLLREIFSQQFFYESQPGRINLGFADTIYVLDEQEFLLNKASLIQFRIDSSLLESATTFENISWTGKTTKNVTILQSDKLPKRLKMYNASDKDKNNQKYRWYFILKAYSIEDNMISITLHKVITNHMINLKIKKEEHKYTLIKNQIGTICR